MSSCVLREKIRMRAILKENTTNYISSERLINVDFRKKYELPVFLIPPKNCKNDRKNDHVSFTQINELRRLSTVF